jgi:hypothetical protein
MRQAHQEVIALHGIPVEGKGMLVVVALVLFDEEARFDAPAVAGTEVATLMNVLAAEWGWLESQAWRDVSVTDPGLFDRSRSQLSSQTTTCSLRWLTTVRTVRHIRCH